MYKMKQCEQANHIALCHMRSCWPTACLMFNKFRIYCLKHFQLMEVSDNQDLDNRRSTVRLKRLNIIHGMPQGSIPRPLLLLLLTSRPPVLRSICDSKSDLILNADESNFIVFAKNQEVIEVVRNIQLYLCISHKRSFCK